ncbi:sodium/proline symporter [Nitrosomonas sp.]|uniref:sodium/proline symporter n=1 Tax=Nitrosomonas sp. TaxID=42353 RepID=UPI00285162B6|nr:sodium/proline symporter [Nitrosomonas sp.]MDR4513732.1 sodium/proline symporter [Nitrosomonas sp.]
MNETIWSFIIVMILLTSSGTMAMIRKRKTPEDYLLASRKVNPWLTALSTVATNNSGFMFIGMIAYTYRFGYESVWLMLGWILGDLMVWIFIHPRVRKISGNANINTLSLLIGTQDNNINRLIVVSAGLITIVFLGIYAAAQLKAGSTALHALFGWEMYVGALVGAVIVIIYSYAGGIRADIWTDAAQSFAMIITMLTILIAGFLKVGGPSALTANLGAQDPSLIAWFPQELQFGVLAFISGYIFAGLGTVGQPHLMTRLLAIKSVDAIKRARVYYFMWYIIFFVASIGVGLYCRAIIPDLANLPSVAGLKEPTELALPLLTMQLLPGIFVGIALAGLFAATVSTADSQIIVCSGTLTQEIFPRWKDSYLASKLGTFAITAIALAIALFAHEGVFGLVLIAWSAMGASLGPVLVLRMFNLPLTAPVVMTMMSVAILTVTLWHFSGFDNDLLKIFPATVAALLIYLCWYVTNYVRLSK